MSASMTHSKDLDPMQANFEAGQRRRKMTIMSITAGLFLALIIGLAVFAHESQDLDAPPVEPPTMVVDKK